MQEVGTSNKHVSTDSIALRLHSVKGLVTSIGLVFVIAGGTVGDIPFQF